VTRRAIDSTAPGISGVASSVASSPVKNAVSPPRGWIAVYPQALFLPREHRLAARTEVTLRDVEGLDLVVPSAGSPHRRALERALLNLGVTWSVAAEVDGWDLLSHFAALGLGAAVINGCVLPPEGLTAVPIRDLPSVRYWAVWRPERDRLAVDVLPQLRPNPSHDSSPR
jgi:LysR family transcriptional regulator, low CO2-responsive transcriptional regulator